MEKSTERILTGFGCKVDVSLYGGPGGGIQTKYYERRNLVETIKTALNLLKENYEVTVFSGGYRNPSSYHGERELLGDFQMFRLNEAGRLTYDFGNSAEGLHLRYGWPLKIFARGYEAHLSGIQPLLEGRAAPLYRFPGGESLVDDIELRNTEPEGEG